MTDFSDLPETVQQALLANSPHMNQADFEEHAYTPFEFENCQGIWFIPQLCYDFHESNYSVLPINLREVASINVGPAMATAYVKEDDTLPAWLVIDPDGGDTDFQIVECV